jgi:hypothetical protein
MKPKIARLRCFARGAASIAIAWLIGCSSISTASGPGTDGGQEQLDAQDAHRACVFDKRILQCDGQVSDWYKGICVDGDCTIAADSPDCQPNTTDPSCIDWSECRNMMMIDISCAEWEAHRDGGAPPADGGPILPSHDAGALDGGAHDSGAPSVDASSPALGTDAGGADGGGPTSEGGPSPGPGH